MSTTTGGTPTAATQSASGYRNDNDLLRAILTDCAGRWVSHDFILSKARYLSGHALTVHSRVSDLRKPPHSLDVECKVERVNGRALSYYRLVQS